MGLYKTLLQTFFKRVVYCVQADIINGTTVLQANTRPTPTRGESRPTLQTRGVKTSGGYNQTEKENIPAMTRPDDHYSVKGEYNN